MDWDQEAKPWLLLLDELLFQPWFWLLLFQPWLPPEFGLKPPLLGFGFGLGLKPWLLLGSTIKYTITVVVIFLAFADTHQSIFLPIFYAISNNLIKSTHDIILYYMSYFIYEINVLSKIMCYTTKKQV